MDSLNFHVEEYTNQLAKGQIQKAYRGIMAFMSDLLAYLERQHTDCSVSALYFGYMDMTYFAFTPSDLKSKKLKVAVVYIHEECRFEVWLAANNRQIQAKYAALLSKMDCGFAVSQMGPGVDSIIASTIVEQPDFDHPEELKKSIETKTMAFSQAINSLLTMHQNDVRQEQ